MGRKRATRKAHLLRRLVAKGLALAGLTAGGLALAPAAHADYGPYTCAYGLVWREATAGDYVCVTPPVREQTWQENALAASRVQPGGGPYGPDTCKSGYVWRGTSPSDHVCVTTSSRTQNRLINEGAYHGYANYPNIPKNGIGAGWQGGALYVWPVSTDVTIHPWEPGRGFLNDVGTSGMTTYAYLYQERRVTPFSCAQSSTRYMYMITVDKTTGVVSNAGRVAVAVCLYGP